MRHIWIKVTVGKIHCVAGESSVNLPDLLIHRTKLSSLICVVYHRIDLRFLTSRVFDYVRSDLSIVRRKFINSGCVYVSAACCSFLKLAWLLVCLCSLRQIPLRRKDHADVVTQRHNFSLLVHDNDF